MVKLPRSGARGRGKLLLATDFSGLQTPSMAVKSLGYEVVLVAACDSKPELRQFTADNFEPSFLEKDVFSRPLRRADIYVVGPFCIKFSHLGQCQGELAPDDSTIEQSLRYIEQVKPKAFVIESVVGLMTFADG